MGWQPRDSSLIPNHLEYEIVENTTGIEISNKIPNN